MVVMKRIDRRLSDAVIDNEVRHLYNINGGKFKWRAAQLIVFL